MADHKYYTTQFKDSTVEGFRPVMLWHDSDMQVTPAWLRQEIKNTQHIE